MSRKLETWTLKRADAVTTLCEGLRRDILGRGVREDRVTVIPNAEKDQLVTNMTAALDGTVGETEMLAIEKRVRDRHGLETNYFQEKHGLKQPTEVKAEKDGDRLRVTWHTAFAGPEPIKTYDIMAGTKRLASVPFRPQLSLQPLEFFVPAAEAGTAEIRVVAVA